VNEHRLPTETLLATAAAFPLEEGESVRISGLPPHYCASEGATILWTGARAREITVSKGDYLWVAFDDYRRLELECGPGLRTMNCDFEIEKGIADRLVWSLCRQLRAYKRLAAAGATIDGKGNIRIPRGMMKVDGSYYDYSHDLKYHPRSYVWTEDNYWRFNFGGIMHKYPEVAHLVSGFFDGLSPRRKARVLAMAMAA
jgi:hypothetical protein